MAAPYDSADYSPFQCAGFEQLTVATAAVGLTPAGGRIQMAIVYADSTDGAVRYRADGTDPTATVGQVLEPGDSIAVYGSEDIASIKFIRRDAASGDLHIAYYSGT